MSPSELRNPGATKGITDEVLAQFSAFITTHMGLHFPKKKWRDLERGLSSASRELGFADPESCILCILSSPLSKMQIETLASHLTVGETYFFRDKRAFDILREEILPRLIRTRRDEKRCLRIWSAGCSSGEEPFSIAILLKEMGSTLRDWNISILATDINTHALRKAAKGVYGDWSFRDCPPAFREKYFIKTGEGHFEILPEIRSMVNFSYLNLAVDSYPSLLSNTNAMDVIFCRNVLMYFSPDLAKEAVERLHRSLVDGGWLIVSPCETSSLLFSKFKAVSFTDAVLYLKEGPGAGDRGSDKPLQYGAESIAGIRTPPPFRPVPVLQPPKPARQTLPADRLPPTQVTPLRRPVPHEEALRLYELGQYPEAEEMLAAFPPAQGEEIMATLLLCRIFANQGKLAEARKLLEQAISAHKLETGLHYLLAMILQEQGHLDEAAESLRRAIYLDHDMVLAHFSLANLALGQGKGNEALKHFGNTLALLGRFKQDDIIPGSEGMTAGRLMEIVRTMWKMGDRDEERGILGR